MPTPALTAEETIAWVDSTFTNWRKFLAENPAALALPCDIYKTSKTVNDLLHHIAVVELRFAQRLAALPEITYDAVPTNIESIFATHVQALALIRERLADPAYDWERELEYDTVSLGRLASTRRTILFHALFHTIRHFAQLATLVRSHGYKTGFQMDYLMMGARKV